MTGGLTPPAARGCGGCDLARRAFLRDAAAAAAALALGLPAEALARTAAAAPSPRPAAAAGRLVYPVPAQDGALVDHEHDVILVRWQGAVYAFALACPHQNTALRWLDRDARFQCPKHKSKYRPDGTFLEGRATRGMDRFAVRREGESIVVETGRLVKQTDDQAGWDAAMLHL